MPLRVIGSRIFRVCLECPFGRDSAAVFCSSLIFLPIANKCLMTVEMISPG